MTNREPQPTWTIDDWLNALNSSRKQFAERFESPGYSTKSFIKFLSELQLKRQFIQTRPMVVAFINAMNAIAEEKQIPIMSCANLHLHAEIFMTSPICKVQFGILSSDEFKSICDDVLQGTDIYDKIIERVHPRPPIQMFGRDKDMSNILELIKTYPITIVNGIGGNGKTALAWHTTQALKQQPERKLMQFDWITDKRLVMDLDNPEAKSIETEPMTFNSILRSIVHRFGWDDLLGMMPDMLFQACVQHLQKQPYLLVVDNLETVENNLTLIGQLLDLLGCNRGQEAVSRVIITSRHAIHIVGCANLHLRGIEPNQRLPFIRYLQPTIGFPALEETQMEALADVTEGNPLFIQFALQRYAITPHLFPNILHDLKQGHIFQNVFEYVIAPLKEYLRTEQPQAFWLARCAAFLEIIHFSDLKEYWQAAFPEDILFDNFYHALDILRRKMILEPVSPRSDEWVMHPLVKAYLRSHGEL